MPVYEYECQSCKKSFEKLQKFSDPQLDTCPECGGKIKKLISLSSFALKGSGWHSTDYKFKAPCTASSKDGNKTSDVPPPINPPCASKACCSGCPSAN